MCAAVRDSGSCQSPVIGHHRESDSGLGFLALLALINELRKLLWSLVARRPAPVVIPRPFLDAVKSFTKARRVHAASPLSTRRVAWAWHSFWSNFDDWICSLRDMAFSLSVQGVAVFV